MISLSPKGLLQRSKRGKLLQRGQVHQLEHLQYCRHEHPHDPHTVSVPLRPLHKSFTSLQANPSISEKILLLHFYADQHQTKSVRTNRVSPRLQAAQRTAQREAASSVAQICGVFCTELHRRFIRPQQSSQILFSKVTFWRRCCRPIGR